MKVLIVCSGNFGYIKPFVSEQVEALNQIGVQTEYYLVKGRGIKGYLMNILPLRKKIKKGKYEIVHAHYGLSGFIATLQNIRPTVVTFHNEEQYKFITKILSSITILLSQKNIFVFRKTSDDLLFKRTKKKIVIPCGVDLQTFFPIEKDIAISEANLPKEQLNILFASDFSKTKMLKNHKLAFEAIKKFTNVNFIELKNYSRQEVNILLNASDLLLLTSVAEGSPQIIKEAMACNCPIVATDVGDINEVIGNTKNCYITGFDPKEISKRIAQVIENNHRTDGRKRIEKFYDNKIIAQKVLEVYRSLL